MLDRFRLPWSPGFCVLAATAAFFLWEEHRAHILGLLPYGLLLLCPVTHFRMHRGHRGHSAGRGGDKNGG